MNISLLGTFCLKAELRVSLLNRWASMEMEMLYSNSLCH